MSRGFQDNRKDSSSQSGTCDETYRCKQVPSNTNVYPTGDIEREAQRLSTDKHASAEGFIAAATGPRALMVAIEPETPADDAGFEPGCYLTSVDGQVVRDIIDWRWLSADDTISIGYVDLDGDAGVVELERAEGEDWGFSFEGVVFDGVKQCRNACTFCFMRQLPKGLRPSLTLRDDDFRLSFLAGTFVTLTNITPEDEARIIQQRITPLRVSLHATPADARRGLIGRHAQHGLEVLDRLLAAGIEAHAQIVLVPNVNDGSVLRETLNWAYARPGIINVGIVPLGFTKYQTMFDHSFNDAPAARAVLQAIETFQQCAQVERGMPWVFAADEFYRSAYGPELLENLPKTSHYGDFSMFEDGIGIIRSHVDEWQAAEDLGSVANCAESIKKSGKSIRFFAGYAMKEHFSPLIARGLLSEVLEPVYVCNTFFGGNVDVTGLLCGCDIVAETIKVLALPQVNGGKSSLFVLPDVMFNDDGVTLDGMCLEDMDKAAGVAFAVVSCNPSYFFKQIAALALQDSPLH